MAYIILTAGGEEIDRVELKSDVVIGRSPECDLQVRDVLMSRRHCRLEQHLGTWRIIDLSSKNGTRLGWDRVRNVRLRDGDTLRIGRTYVTFKAGMFEPGNTPPRRARLVRPADPYEALAGTVAGFVLDDEESEIPQSPALAGGHLSPSPGDDEPAWAADLPDEHELATMPARPRRSTAHWAPPTPQPRYDLPRSIPRMTDLSLQVHPQTDFHIATRNRQSSDRRLFLAILVTVATLTGAATALGTWWVSAG